MHGPLSRLILAAKPAAAVSPVQRTASVVLEQTLRRLQKMGCGASNQQMRYAAPGGDAPLSAKQLRHELRALATAARKQEKIAAAADAADPHEKASNRAGACTLWGLRTLEPLLENITLIDVQYLIALGEAGGVVPCWQDVPAAARIDADNVWRLRGYNGGVPILVLSNPWLDSHHPDKHGVTLRRLLPVLRACRDEASRMYKNGIVPGGGIHAMGAHCTFGVFWDYMSMHQGSTVPYAARTKDLATMAGCAAPRAPAPPAPARVLSSRATHAASSSTPTRPCCACARRSRTATTRSRFRTRSAGATAIAPPTLVAPQLRAPLLHARLTHPRRHAPHTGGVTSRCASRASSRARSASGT